MDMSSISIEIDGNKVIATMEGFSGVAVCSPHDEFDFFTGARVALDRLEEEYENKNNEFSIGDIVEVDKTGYVCEGDGYFSDVLLQGKIIGFNKKSNEKYIVRMVTGKEIKASEYECELVKKGLCE